MSVKPAETRRLYLQIADKLRGMIGQKDFAPNGRLPSERELAQTLGVSRPSVREALVALELEGRVEIRMGSGVYISATPTARPPSSEAELGESPIEIMNARSVIEGAIAASVAPFAKPKALKALRTVYETMAREVESGQIPMSADRAFHITIAQMSGNDVLVRTVGALYDERHSPLSSTLRGHFEGEETWAAALTEHRDILEALEARDAVQAQAAMQRHMRNSAARLMTRRKS
ncbi:MULTISPECIES: FadR/GntR family transcriptional regulator [unclassified Caballeronia]|uniref:FadR/GntR family transcriptional regulator n=1 Tax=unclassified Caballeronia TaxID=2646786 RepID=UPI0028673857|nr:MULTISPECIES: FadR/GntR family transcriptional regulator [unclassified Caballeronia]MDR5737399.1 FadR/GntR family transcriptional regulator [Caballeronia sp. LZ016]MDR5810072.1 FadR/GntR family transcriptional regulator [Caballeronia sp. LZ019]